MQIFQMRLLHSVSSSAATECLRGIKFENSVVHSEFLTIFHQCDLYNNVAYFLKITAATEYLKQLN